MKFDPQEVWVFIVQILISISVCYHFFGKIRVLYLIPWLIFLISATILSSCPWLEFSYTNDKRIISELGYSGALHWGLLLGMPLLVYWGRKYVDYFIHFMFVFFCVDSLFMFWDLGKTGSDFGLINGNTYDAAMMALFMPLFGLKGLIFLAPIFYYKAKTAMVMLFFMGLFLLIKNRKYLLATFVFSFFGVLAFYQFKSNPKLLLASTRIEYWDLYLQWIDRFGNFFVGTGVGSFPAIAAWIGVKRGEHIVSHYLAHNDYLEVFWELGAVGLICLLLVILVTYRNLDLIGKTVVVGFSVFMLAYFPLQSVPSQILALILIVRAHEEKSRASSRWLRSSGGKCRVVQRKRRNKGKR